MWLFRLLTIVLFVLLASCSSTTRDYKGVYEASEKIEDLDVPPGLDKPITTSETNLNELGQNVKSYSSYELQSKDQPTSQLDTQYKGMKFKRDGSLFWLEVQAPAETVWDDVRAYFTRLGFEIVVEQKPIGFMQTDWLENKADLPGGWLRSFMGMLYSADVMDRYRVRLEWDRDTETSRLFIIHQGVREVVVGERNDSEVVETKWVVRPSEPDLEVEMLMRFMAYRGLEEAIAEQQVDGVKREERAKLIEEPDHSQLVIADSFQRSWRHMTIAIDRLGYLVEDKNRTAGVFYIQLPETFEIKKDSTLGALFFGELEKPEHYKYLIILEQKGSQTIVTVKANGDVPKDFTKVSRKILKDIQANIL